MTKSSKPLFRAISGASKRVLPPGMFGELPEAQRPNCRNALDYYPTTSPAAIRALLAVDGRRIAALGSVWEPAAGKGDLVGEIRAAGLPCLASDIHDHGMSGVVLKDFYAWDTSPAPVIITNPPYDQINARDGHGRWLRHTLDMPGWYYCALLLSWDWPAALANGLGALLDARPFTRAYLMRWKIDFTGEGSPPQRNAWFVWDRADPRNTTDNLPDFCWVNRPEKGAGQPDLFDRTAS